MGEMKETGEYQNENRKEFNIPSYCGIICGIAVGAIY